MPLKGLHNLVSLIQLTKLNMAYPPYGTQALGKPLSGPIPPYNSLAEVPLLGFGYVDGQLYHNPNGTPTLVGSGTSSTSVQIVEGHAALSAPPITSAAAFGIRYTDANHNNIAASGIWSVTAQKWITQVGSVELDV